MVLAAPDGARRSAPAAPPPRRPRASLRAGLASLFLSGVSALPRERALAAAAAAGRAFARLGGPRVGVARINLRIAFPEWSEAQRERVLEAALANMARGLVEVAFLRDLRRENLDELFEFEGLERIDRARAASKSGAAIALTGHFGSFELLAPVLSLRGYPVSLVYRPRTDPGIERIIDGWRTRAGVETIPRGQAARATLRALRDGRCVGMPLDQDVGRREGVFVPFFSRLACTRDGPARIAVRAGVEVVPIFLFRIGASARHRVRVYDPVPLVREGDPDAAARENTWRMNKVFEAAIREAPDHWAWTHRRWRTQPPGDPRPYPSRRR